MLVSLLGSQFVINTNPYTVDYVGTVFISSLWVIHFFPIYITTLSRINISDTDSHSKKRGEYKQDYGKYQVSTHPTVMLNSMLTSLQYPFTFPSVSSFQVCTLTDWS